jgi:predicted phage terminase large subunit-like protein
MTTTALLSALEAQKSKGPLQNPVLFAKEVLHIDLPPHQAEALRAMARFPRLLLNDPKGHGKTTTAGFILPIWRIAKDPNSRGILGSASMERAQDLVRAISLEIQTNQILRDTYKIIPSDPWNATQIQIKRTRNVPHPTLTAAGVGKNIEGIRADWAILDDIIDEGSLSGAENRAAKRWLDHTLLPRLEPDAWLTVNGTVWHREDLYSHIAAKPGWHRIVRKAIIDESIGEVLWKEHWSLQRLQEIRDEIGVIAFEQAYQNNPLALTGLVFNPEWMRIVKSTDLPEGTPLKVQGWDLAISTRETADYTVGITLAHYTGGERPLLVCIEIVRGHWSFPEGLAQIRAACARHSPSVIAIESNAFQKAMPQQLLREATIPIVESPATGDKTMRVQELAVMMQNGSFAILDECPGKEVFMRELLSFPVGDHEDTVDAAWHAVRATNLGRTAYMDRFEFRRPSL